MRYAWTDWTHLPQESLRRFAIILFIAIVYFDGKDPVVQYVASVTVIFDRLVRYGPHVEKCGDVFELSPRFLGL